VYNLSVRRLPSTGAGSAFSANHSSLLSGQGLQSIEYVLIIAVQFMEAKSCLPLMWNV